MQGTGNTRKRRVAVVYTHALGGRGIAQLLQADERLQVTCLEASPAATSEQLKRLQPDAIVLEECGSDSLLWGIARDLPPTLFIGVHFKDNLMEIYHGRQIVSAGPENLVEAIHRGLKRPRRLSPR